MYLEDTFYKMAQKMNQPVVILYNRGTMDRSSFMTEKTWQALLDETSWSTISLRDKRYDAVIHLVTSAEGAEHYF